MESFNDDALQAAAGPGLEKVKAQFEAVAKDMAGRPADDVHQELVKRLEAEPFAWDDKGLRDIASSISQAASGADDPEDSPDDEKQSASDEKQSASDDPTEAEPSPGPGDGA
jgi:hypothetical protein